jgi:hypothetical protein
LNGKNNDKQQRSSSSTQNISTDDTQRALVLQGGGSLGAYEVGAIKTLYKIISEEDKRNGKPDRLLFDIIAGTSIGAMNAARKRSWEDSIKELECFWTDVDKGVAANPKDLDIIKQLPWYTPWKKQNEKEGNAREQEENVGWHDKILSAASEEAAILLFAAIIVVPFMIILCSF